MTPTRRYRDFRYRLYPTRAQETTLRRWLYLTRELYNAALQERRDAWAKQGVSISFFDQDRQLSAIRTERDDVATTPVAILSATLRRLDGAFQAFFRRCKSGEKPGYPRFKGRDRVTTLEINSLQTQRRPGPIVSGGKRIKVPLLGRVKFKQHRPIEGRPKTMRLKFDGDGHWYVILCCEHALPAPLAPTGREVGVDLGLTTFAATSDGEMFANPRAAEQCRIGVERAARRVSRRKRGSNRRRKAVQLLARKRFHEAQVRRQHHIDTARALVRKYDAIHVEALNIRGLARGMLAKSVNDAGWSTFLYWLRVKAESAGREVIAVDPRNTSKSCSQCGVVGLRLPLRARLFKCADCGFECDRDVNAARNILSAGRALRGGAAVVDAPRRSEKACVLSHCTTPTAGEFVNEGRL